MQFNLIVVVATFFGIVHGLPLTSDSTLDIIVPPASPPPIFPPHTINHHAGSAPHVTVQDGVHSQVFAKTLTFKLGNVQKFPTWNVTDQHVVVSLQYKYSESALPFIETVLPLIEASGSLVQKSSVPSNIKDLATFVSWSEDSRVGNQISGHLSLTFGFLNDRSEELFTYKVRWLDHFFAPASADVPAHEHEVGEVEDQSWSQVITELETLPGTCGPLYCPETGGTVEPGDLTYSVTPMIDCVGGPAKCPRVVTGGRHEA